MPAKRWDLRKKKAARPVRKTADFNQSLRVARNEFPD
jgi:hypothetical protein